MKIFTFSKQVFTHTWKYRTDGSLHSEPGITDMRRWQFSLIGFITVIPSVETDEQTVVPSYKIYSFGHQRHTDLISTRRLTSCEPRSFKCRQGILRSIIKPRKELVDKQHRLEERDEDEG